MGNWSVDRLSDFLNTWGIWGHVIGALLAFIQTMIPLIPFVVVAGANVLLFGLWLGVLVNYVMSVLGAIAIFWLARNFGRHWIERKLERYAYIQLFNDRMEHNGFFYIAVSRVIPVLPSFGINWAAAVMRVKTRDFILGTIVGNLPTVLLESFIGHDLLHFEHNKSRLFILLGIFIILLVIGHICKNKWFRTDEKTTK
ncbi:TVP38/TMEM64 family protein [Paenibacillus agricola]|uniref:TVP38/TMEM64 family membrane protein n=1 Tax=Paenibacillus agricola TaxID=2716264 RepID=A0ABX0IX32_9BACL|nr:TVP38/TMEM64 family protein [Paenibacillus agricola]NHN28484.1 TVP38/TMEM64 family protein [Paenibacillus agricola]